MVVLFTLTVLVGIQLAIAQHPTGAVDNYPLLTVQECTKAGGCTTKNTAIVLDSLSHPVFQVNNPNLNCGDWGESADPAVCPDATTCQANCAMSGVFDYASKGVTTSGSTLTLNQIVNGVVVSPRVYVLTSEMTKYEMLKLIGKEFTFDVDQSKLPCGMNSAVCLMEMEEDGGYGGLNTAGAAWGTGYCDAQCFTTPFINGLPNLDGKGACCNKLDVWEGNRAATSIAPHVCNKPSLFTCTGNDCGFDGSCDEWGCGYNTYRNGAKTFYGPGTQYAVDTTKPFTVVTQFPTYSSGKLTQINRIYRQNGKKIQQPNVNLSGVPAINYVRQDYCDATGMTKFKALGGMTGMGQSMARGMTLVFSIWWDESGFMNWLDSGDAGPCSSTEGNPSVIRTVESNPTVKFSNIKWGEIGST